MMRCYLFESKSVSPFINLAFEEHLLGLIKDENTIIFYLWQNDNTIVIGRNQNAYAECNMEFAKEYNVLIARRLTGGGTVYHDLGNLNFSIIVPKRLHDITRSTNMVSQALVGLGISAFPNGRNDICLGDKKISGNAYYSNAEVGLHHGTILYQADVNKIEKILSIPKYKLEKRGIASVRSRIGDIISLHPYLGIEDIKEALKESFFREYGINTIEKRDIPDKQYAHLIAKYSSDEWRFGKYKDFEVSVNKTFNWGIVNILLKFNREKIQDIEVSTDAMDVAKIEELRNWLNREIQINQRLDLHQILSEFDVFYRG